MHIFTIGALQAEIPNYKHELETWRDHIVPAAGPLRFISPVIAVEEFKGVGAVAFLQTAVEVKAECQ